MKKILTLLFLLPCLFAFAQKGISRDSLEKLVKTKALNDPRYKKVVTDVAEVRANIQLAHKGRLKADYVVKDYNARLGLGMGKKQTLAEVESRMNTAGDTFIKYMLLITASKISLEEAKRLGDTITKLQSESN